jgi:hypothetical protein
MGCGCKGKGGTRNVETTTTTTQTTTTTNNTTETAPTVQPTGN